jgi:protein-S-isoprenylcysteine O-methyltransferase Ste14
MATDSAHKKWWQIGEVAFGIPFLAALILQVVFPYTFPGGIYPLILLPLGIIFCLAGIALITSARRELARYAQPTDPGMPTTRMVATGVFSISRNPLYLGAVCFIAGVSLIFNLVWGLVFLPVGMLFCHYMLIAPEETYLDAKFGDEYRLYASRVHRWLGHH